MCLLSKCLNKLLACLPLNSLTVPIAWHKMHVLELVVALYAKYCRTGCSYDVL